MPPAAWVLFGGSFVNRFGSFVLIFLVIWLTEEGYSPAQAGADVSSYLRARAGHRPGRRQRAYAANATAFWLSCGALGVVAALLMLGVAPRRRTA